MKNFYDSRNPSGPCGMSCWKGTMNLLEDFKKVIRVEVGSRKNTSHDR